MLPTKDLKDVLKDAQTVTSLATTDRVLITDANGEPKKISKTGLDGIVSFTCKANTWYRIVTSVGNLSTVGQLLIVSSPSEQECFSLKWSIPRTSYYSKSMIDIFNPISSGTLEVMTKMRVCRPNSSGYGIHFDVFFAKARNITVRLDSSLNADVNIIENPQTTGLGVFEYDLKIFGGG